MGDYERTLEIDVPAKRLFDFAGCSVTMFLHTEQVDSAGVQSGLAETLDTIKRLVEEPVRQPQT